MSATDPRAASGATALVVGGWGGMVAGIALACAGLLVLTDPGSAPLAMPATMMVLGVSGALASFLAMRRVRIAWAFALSIHGTAGLVFLLGTPKLRTIMEAHGHAWFNGMPLAQQLLLCSIPALVAITVTVFLALAGDQLEP